MNEVLYRKLERLKEEIHYLEINKTKFLKNLQTSIDIKKITERSIYLCTEIVLDISEMSIAIKGLPKPSTYSDSIYKLGDYKIIPKSFAHKFIYIAGLRNFLAHDYQIDTTPDLKRFLKLGLNDIKRFINFIEKL
ncbi:MAG: HepT-like ribonuclease domain-containing protein [Nitrospirota bacterium]